ncbi:MAG: Ig-like domain-containing protein [Clostridiales bacterium]|nr:Ig-like domain-containing protein [Clostridiales bacterium]
MKKRLMSCLLVLILIVSSLITSNYAQAAVKINKSKVTMYVGKSTQLKVTGTTKKVTWSTDNKSVAIVSSKGKVTAKEEGSATITARTNGKTYKCYVTVLSNFSSKDAVKNIQCELQDTGDGVVAILKNGNKVAVSISAKLVYYNNSGNMIMATSDSNNCLEPNASCALFFRGPYDSDYKDLDYSDYKITMSVEKTYADKYDSSKIQVNSHMGENVTAEFTNNSDYDLEYITVAIVYYDVNGNAIGYDNSYVYCESAGSVDFKTFDFPYDSEYNTIIPNSYKIFINSAYQY